jgi:hypothetical protein
MTSHEKKIILFFVGFGIFYNAHLKAQRRADFSKHIIKPLAASFPIIFPVFSDHTNPFPKEPYSFSFEPNPFEPNDKTPPKSRNKLTKSIFSSLGFKTYDSECMLVLKGTPLTVYKKVRSLYTDRTRRKKIRHLIITRETPYYVLNMCLDILPNIQSITIDKTDIRLLTTMNLNRFKHLKTINVILPSLTSNIIKAFEQDASQGDLASFIKYFEFFAENYRGPSCTLVITGYIPEDILNFLEEILINYPHITLNNPKAPQLGSEEYFLHSLTKKEELR